MYYMELFSQLLSDAKYYVLAKEFFHFNYSFCYAAFEIGNSLKHYNNIIFFISFAIVLNSMVILNKIFF